MNVFLVSYVHFEPSRKRTTSNALLFLGQDRISEQYCSAISIAGQQQQTKPEEGLKELLFLEEKIVAHFYSVLACRNGPSNSTLSVSHSTKSHISEVAQICLGSKPAFVSVVCVSLFREEGMVLQHLLLLLYPEKVLSSRCSYHRRYRKPIRHHATEEKRLLLAGVLPWRQMSQNVCSS